MAMLIIIALVLALIMSWVMTTYRKLVVMDENINNAMIQIGVQLSSRFDALTALLELVKDYAAYEAHPLIETIKSCRSIINAKSTPDEVLKQEGVQNGNAGLDGSCRNHWQEKVMRQITILSCVV